MSAMTWGELKRAIEAAGVDDATEVNLIDLEHPQADTKLSIIASMAENNVEVTDGRSNRVYVGLTPLEVRQREAEKRSLDELIDIRV